MSYQMINTLPCNRDDVRNIADNSISYVEKIKTDGAEFEKFLRKNANAVNHYEMLADLYSHNPDFADSTWFRHEKKKIISEYVFRLRTGKITVNGDNLTLCGNPYALLLHSVGEDYRRPSFLMRMEQYSVIPRDLETMSIYVRFVTRIMLRIIYVTYIMFTVMLWRDTSHLAKILLQ